MIKGVRSRKILRAGLFLAVCILGTIGVKRLLTTNLLLVKSYKVLSLSIDEAQLYAWKTKQDLVFLQGPASSILTLHRIHVSRSPEVSIVDEGKAMKNGMLVVSYLKFYIFTMASRHLVGDAISASHPTRMVLD